MSLRRSRRNSQGEAPAPAPARARDESSDDDMPEEVSNTAGRARADVQQQREEDARDAAVREEGAKKAERKAQLKKVREAKRVVEQARLEAEEAAKAAAAERGEEEGGEEEEEEEEEETYGGEDDVLPSSVLSAVSQHKRAASRGGGEAEGSAAARAAKKQRLREQQRTLGEGEERALELAEAQSAPRHAAGNVYVKVRRKAPRATGGDAIDALATANSVADAFLAQQSSRVAGRRVSAAKFLSIKKAGPSARFGHKNR